MFRVGLTGNVASGKSSVARHWERLGAALIDADVLARTAVAPGSAGLERVREAFGPDVIAGDGTLDRAALRDVVFHDPEARRRLESITHPEIHRLRQERERELEAGGAAIVVHDIPLLFEIGLESEFDMVVLVDADYEVRAGRLRRDRGLDPDTIRGIMKAQTPAAGKRGRADIVIENDGTLEELEERASAAWREIQRRAGVRGQGASAGRLRVDMHLHTRASFDCRSDPRAVLERALERGMDRICVTDHNEVEAAMELAAAHPDRVIVGEEVKTAERVDIIGLYLTDRIPGGTPARETCERIRDQGGIVYVPHPFVGGKGGGGRILPEVEDLVQVVEGFNARIHNQALNRRAQDWAAERGVPQGAGSDAHTVGEVGRAWVDVPAFNNDAGSFLAALRHGRLHGTESSRLVHLASTVAKLLP